MPRDPALLALARCGREVIASTNGHGRRWAAERCTRALVATGTPASIAANTTQAMVAVALGIAEGAANLQGRAVQCDAVGGALLPDAALAKVIADGRSPVSGYVEADDTLVVNVDGLADPLRISPAVAEALAAFLRFLLAHAMASNRSAPLHRVIVAPSATDAMPLDGPGPL